MPVVITKPSDVLRAAKKKLCTDYDDWKRNDGAIRHICIAVEHTPCSVAIQLQVKAHIMHLISGYISYSSWTRGGYISYSSWLRGEYPEVDREIKGMTDRECFEKMQATRHAWVDDMIAYWEARGE